MTSHTPVFIQYSSFLFDMSIACRYHFICRYGKYQQLKLPPTGSLDDNFRLVAGESATKLLCRF